MISPMKTEQKKKVMGMFTIGADMFRNQLGVIGKNLKKSRKKNKQSWFSSTWGERRTLDVRRDVLSHLFLIS